jgi:hypothetical protein
MLNLFWVQHFCGRSVLKSMMEQTPPIGGVSGLYTVGYLYMVLKEVLGLPWGLEPVILG